MIIWDLDATVWKGTLSAEDVMIPEENRSLIRKLTDAGIVNSICSKNAGEHAMAELMRQKMEKYFVFPSINWEPKGGRVKQLIKDLQLRPANVRFLDDNPSNREEGRYFCPEIMPEGPEVIPQLCTHVRELPAKDPEHKRLEQYRILEEKYEEKQQYG